MPNPLVYLTEDEVIRFNESVTGQKGLLRDRAALDSALNRPKMAAFYQQEDIIEQAALLIEGIAMNHPFIDGNKRTALVTGITFLRTNGATIRSETEEAAHEVEQLVIGRDLFRFTTWLRIHIVPYPESKGEKHP